MLFKRIETTPRNAHKYVGKVNSETFIGKPVNTVLCTSIDATETMQGWEIKYGFQHNDSWSAKVTSGVVAEHELYPRADFNMLELTAGEEI